MKVKITTEASKALHEATPYLGPWVPTDTAMVDAEFTEDTYAKLLEEAKPGESLSDTIIRLCKIAMMMKDLK